MLLKLAPSVLLSILCCSNEATAFNAARPALTSRPSAGPRQTTIISMTNDFDADAEPVAASELSRRNALARFAAAAAASATLFGSTAAFAADKPSAEFSEAPTSEASIARMAYNEKLAKEGAPSADFDGNEAGPVGAGDEGTQPPVEAVAPAPVEAPAPAPAKKTGITMSGSDRTRLERSGLPKLGQNLADPKIIGGTVALFGVMALAANSDMEEETKEAKEAEWAPPAAVPYGMREGRRYYDGVDIETAKKEGLLPPPPAPVEPEPEETPSWALPKPTPYGIANPSGSNPYLKEVLEYCQPGNVSKPCADSIRTFLDDIADTGAAATAEEAEVVAEYLDSLGGNGEAGAAFTSYLDALSEGSVPPPSSAEAVKSYLDAIASDFNGFDNRLTSIEGRVTDLETKVGQIPDKVFEKVEALQSRNEERVSNEVKKIIEAVAPSAPEPVAEVPTPEPEPVAPAPAVQANPLGSAIPERSAMPQPMGEFKKGYGFGSGASWKTGGFKPVNQAVAEVAIPEPVPEPPSEIAAEMAESQPEPEPVVEAPAVQASPLGAVPERSAMPQPTASGGPKKQYGLGSGGRKAGGGPKKRYGLGSGGWKSN
eukprot:CAMPEP_0183705824 /NCGR_PEP_ID=MMETSP0737-20130205/2830_1 /TAXON_ID=385413 /ORGANISM="Thalassiosira miniscula, Strain CCMP1093" /LENGTH=598 /DNA_ID=CAMNT_0025933079 /DNA_START=85 /DNA_END=1881 /DNA_ORIENTATION=-